MKKNSRGFTLLLAAIVSSIVLSLGAAIYEIATKQIALSSLGRDSQLAFFAADTGAECALFWDVRFGYFATLAPASVVAPDPQCDGSPLTVSGRPASAPYYDAITHMYQMTFTFAPGASATVPGGYCTDVFVTKCNGTFAVDGSCTFGDPAQVSTSIHADALSTDCATRLTNSHALQRSVELHY